MDEMEQQIMFEMSENLQAQKQSTETIKFQIEKLLQSQAKLQAKLIESQKNLETVMPRFFSQTSIPLRPPSQPPDPPDFDKSNLKFDGTLLREWVLRCEQFFMKNNIPPEQKVRIISIHMVGEAFHWHCDFIRNRFGIFPSWPDYIVALSAKFGKLFDDPLSELMSLKQCGDSVETYLEKFDRALSRLSLSMPHAVNIFLSNMNPHLASHVKQFDVTTVAYAAWVAKLFEPSLLHTPAIQPRAPFSPYQNQNNQFHYNSPNTTSSLPLLETNKLPYKPNIPTKTDMEKSPKKLCCEEIQERGMTGMFMSSDGSCHLESKKSQIFVKECEDASMSGDEASHETNSVLEKETIPPSALCQRVPVTLSQNNNVTQQEELNYDMETTVENGLVQEHESLGLTDSVLKVDCVHSQEFSSQFQVPIPSLEPSRRHHKESLVVVNDLSYDHGCVIGKTIESICNSELGQDNSLDEEEFKGLKLGKLSKNERRLSAVCLLEKKEVTKIISAWNNRVWEPGGVLIERDKWKWSGKCHELSIVVWLMQGLSSTRWSYGKVAVLRQELQQPKTNLKEIKLKELDRLTACSSVGTETWLVKCSCEYKIQKLLLCYHSLKVQEKQLFPEDNVEFPEVSIISMRKGLVCDKEKERLRNVKAAGCLCDLDQVNSLDEEEFMGFTEFSKPQLAMEFLLLNSGLFMNTRLLHDKINSVFVALALLVVSEHNKAIRTCYEKAEKVDKHKINFTVAVIDEHEDIETACVLLKMSLNGSAHTLSHLVKDNDDGRRNTWFKLTLYSVSQQTTSSTPQSNEVQRETNWNDVTQTEAAWGAKHTSLGYVENSLAEFCAYEVYHHPRPPELSRYKEDEESTATESVSAIVGDNEAKVQKFSSLRTRMFSSREYCDRVYLNHLSISISN